MNKKFEGVKRVDIKELMTKMNEHEILLKELVLRAEEYNPSIGDLTDEMEKDFILLKKNQHIISPKQMKEFEKFEKLIEKIKEYKGDFKGFKKALSKINE